jgi:hypothetical protein
MADLHQEVYEGKDEATSPEGHEEKMIKLAEDSEKKPQEGIATDNVEIAPKPEGVPDKFYNAETGKVDYDSLAKSYNELEKKQSQPKQDKAEEPKTAEEAVENAGLDMSKLSQEYADNNGLTDGSYEALNKAGIDRATVDQYIAGQQALASQAQASAYEITGGEANYKAMTEYAKANLTQEALQSYNTAVNSPDKSVRELAVRGLHAQYSSESGSGNNLVMGKGNEVTGSGYQSKEQMIADMKKPEYLTDPAFRASVERKVAQSNI